MGDIIHGCAQNKQQHRDCAHSHCTTQDQLSFDCSEGNPMQMLYAIDLKRQQQVKAVEAHVAQRAIAG